MEDNLYFEREHQSSVRDYYELLSNRRVSITLPRRLGDKFNEIVILAKEDYDELKREIDDFMNNNVIYAEELDRYKRKYDNE